MYFKESSDEDVDVDWYESVSVCSAIQDTKEGKEELGSQVTTHTYTHTRTRPSSCFFSRFKNTILKV